MSRRERQVHPTALPLYRRIEQGQITRSEVAKRLGLNHVQTITNWLSNGIPAKRLHEVARACGISLEQYCAESGIGSSTDNLYKLVSNYEALPSGLQSYVLHKVKELRKYSDTLPEFIRGKITPPDEPRQFLTWESEIQKKIQEVNGK